MKGPGRGEQYTCGATWCNEDLALRTYTALIGAERRSCCTVRQHFREDAPA
jgi:hypothetical protein